MLKVHHLELFYYVGKFRGLTQASRHMPYGLSQPALSRQLKELERDAGTILFQRRPFELTTSGKMLYAFVRPFFENLKGFPSQLQMREPSLVRIAGPPVVLRDYLPPILQPLAAAYPELSFSLKAGMQGEIEEWFGKSHIDLAVTMLESKLPRHCEARPLLHLPLALLVPTASTLQSADHLWREPRIKERLISPPAGDAIASHFELGLRQQAVAWNSRVEVNSIELVESYVAKGFGIGVTLMVPGCAYIPEVRVLPLPGFPPVPIGMIWRNYSSPATLVLMQAMEREAKLLGQLQGHHASAA